MKKVLIPILCILLLFGCACKKETETAVPMADSEQVIRIESVDGMTVKATDMVGDPLAAGEEKTYTMIEETVIEFPMADDMTQTVAITAAELQQELADFRKTNSEDLLFLAMLGQGEIVGLAYYAK